MVNDTDKSIPASATARRVWLSRSDAFILGIAALLAGLMSWHLLRAAGADLRDQALRVPPPSAALAAQMAATTASISVDGLQTLTLAGGCFWGVQAVFQHTRGVTNAVSGYAGGDAATAQYSLVAGGQTAHAEAVQITYDPREVSLGTLLQVFFAIAHDPTQLNRQGPDEGPQYRSAIFVRGEAQRRQVAAYVAELTVARVFTQPIVTEVQALSGFYPAEPLHQNYATRHPDSDYIRQFDAPKLAAFKTALPAVFRREPKLVPG
ncbi:MAG: hypothetical protein RLZZ126_1267 [Pseudomonadota bacterium]|jgi:peptide-methionine (S)-S-oxide reductase